MSNFNTAVQKTLGKEGVFSNNPNDRGKKTKYGITEKLLISCQNKGLISKLTKIEDLTVPQAIVIYRSEFWNALKLDLVPSQVIAEEIFDTAVNTGPDEAARIVQKSVNYLGSKVKVDGKLGPITIGEVNRWVKKDEVALFKVLNGYQFLHYESLVRNDPTQLDFARGWMKRVQEYHMEKS